MLPQRSHLTQNCPGPIVAPAMVHSELSPPTPPTLPTPLLGRNARKPTEYTVSVSAHLLPAAVKLLASDSLPRNTEKPIVTNEPSAA